ncbi:unnamed protein product [Caenorhabditis angaria]|uniref:SH3 domain-containing protein n=1 Tax=Caenorhabditis angaria TaxID=860376 RepID=A0A9P1J0Z8_9PELO|nr:unnamed protein product [Caenorhabditis angaria]
MSRYSVPVPDYDFTIRQKNPFIPQPDYTTIKYNKPKFRPSLNHIGTEFSQQTTIPETIEQPKENRFSRPPKLTDVNSNFEIKVHSYKEDQKSEEDPHPRSTLEHIKQIGVPVIPGIIRQQIPVFEASAPVVSSEQNKAFLRHLENHKKFDTVRGDRPCELCEIMRKQQEAEYQHHSRQNSWSEHRGKVVEYQQPQYNSDTPPRRKRTDVRSLFPQHQINEEPEPEPFFSSEMTARARHNYEMKREGEISIRALDTVEILHMEQGYALCRRSDNIVGWIPSTVFDIPASH